MILKKLHLTKFIKFSGTSQTVVNCSLWRFWCCFCGGKHLAKLVNLQAQIFFSFTLLSVKAHVMSFYDSCTPLAHVNRTELWLIVCCDDVT